MYKTIIGKANVDDGVTPDFIALELKDLALESGTPEYQRVRFQKFRVSYTKFRVSCKL